MTTAALATALEDIVHSCKRAIEADIKVCLVVPGPPPRTETVRLVPGRKRCTRRDRQLEGRPTAHCRIFRSHRDPGVFRRSGPHRGAGDQALTMHTDRQIAILAVSASK